MSQFALFKGEIPTMPGLETKKYPFDGLIEKVCLYHWKNVDKSNIWTIKSLNNEEFDYFFCEAQREINLGYEFAETKIYSLLNEILATQTEAFFWYSEYYDDLPLIKTIPNVLSSVYEGIVNETGMCEVYINFKNTATCTENHVLL